jgi:hypothetical protein
MTNSIAMTTFRRPSTATMAPLEGRPIAVRWWGAPEDEALEIPPDVPLAASFDATTTDDGRIILVPSGPPLERADTDVEPAAPQAPPGKRAAPAPVAKKAKGSTASASAATRGAATGGQRRPAAGRPAKTAGSRPKKRS